MEKVQKNHGFVLRASVCLLALAALTLLGSTASAGNGDDREVTVMTRNVYFGASLQPVIESESALEMLFAVAAVWDAVHDTDFPDRAEALADEIADAMPLLIGLQEAALWRIQSPGDILSGGTTPAEDVVYDFTAILLDALEDRGLSYEVIVTQDDADFELPSITGDDVRFTDRDVILARSDLETSELKIEGTDAAHFENLAYVPLAGSMIPILRGWVAADVKIRGKQFRFLNTHLEDDPFPAAQEAQAEELLDGPVADVDIPVLLVGDLNSDAFGAGTDSYDILLDGGFEDAWTTVYPLVDGLTFGHDEDLLNEDPGMTERIDFVLYLGNFEVEAADVVGEEDGDQSPGGLWPSDHAGLWATLPIPSDLKR